MDISARAEGKYTEYMQNRIRQFAGKFRITYCQEDLQDLYGQMMKVRHTSAYLNRKADLVQALKACAIPCGVSDSDEHLGACIAHAPRRESANRIMMSELHGLYREFPRSEDFMERLVRRLGDPDFRQDPVRLAILKQFLRHTDYGTAPVFTLAREQYHIDGDEEAVLDALDESIFDILGQKLSRDDRRKYALLKLADDLAFGKFRTNGKTKKDLYMFAFAFNMTSFSDHNAQDYDPRRDIEKKLFFDFYQNNLLRYLSEDYRKNGEKYEPEPTGEGINYKNYAEAIYLYYLHRRDMEPRKKIKKAELMIKKCDTLAASIPQADTAAIREQWQITDDYRMLFDEEIWKVSEKELPEYICSRYVIGTGDSSKTKLAAVQRAQRAALNNYLELLEENAGAYEMPKVFDVLMSGLAAAAEGDDPAEAAAAAEILKDADFVELLQRMEQLIKLRIPSPAVILANALNQEGKERQARQILALAACLEALDDRLKQSELQIRAARSACFELKRNLEEQGVNRAADVAKLVNVFLDYARLAHAAIWEDRRRLDGGFREMVRKFCAESGSEPDMIGIHGLLIALRQRIVLTEEKIAAAADALPMKLTQIRGQLADAGVDAPLADKLLREVDNGWHGACINHLRQTRADYVDCIVAALASMPEGDADAWTAVQDLAEAVQLLKNQQDELAEFERIGRTSLIAVEYCAFYNERAGEPVSMPQVLEEFRAQVDDVLEASRYQKLSEKNLFDMFVVFSLYYSVNFGASL